MRMTWKTQQAMQDDDIRAARIHLALIPVTVMKRSSCGKIFGPLTEIPVGKTEISGTKPACTLKWTHLKVYKRFRGKARSRKLGSCEEAPSVCKVSPTIMDKSLGTLAFLGRFIIHTGIPLPLPHKQCWTRVFRIAFQNSTLYRVGKGRTAWKFKKRMHCFMREPRNNRKKRVSRYCPKDFCPWL